MRILLVEDEPEMAAALQSGLHRHGMLVDVASDIASASEALQSKVHDLLLLDRQLPDGDGATLVAKARAGQSDLPVIMLTARGSLAERIEGLDQGADDYLVKPFALEELLARIRAISRRPAKVVLPTVNAGRLRFDFSSREALVDGTPLRLPRRQLLLLEALAYRLGRTVQREVLLDAVYGFDDAIQSNAFDAHVSKLRRALTESDAGVEIHAIRGIGYILRETVHGRA
ncbi:response regulator transcription factor [Luteibacter anthropi]|uniref:Response regulator transcription factor n=1 Tax=Luteibacter anthropi TaxID=564369 RepID=A0A7X5UA57_9GAMM|nr:response regulator transcription factor [Luteibacter anthropi]NII06735.1 response regulator transcription factor [Luteibacter anthropi]URX61585.1 response regulator transcription factor [Luteibacter anthropi]